MKLVTNGIKSKFIYYGQGKVLNGEGSWSFGNGFARNAVLFCVATVHHLILIIEEITFLY